MTSKPRPLTDTTQLTAPTPHLPTVPEPGSHTFGMRFTSTPRGARLARRLTAVRLDAWGVPYDTGAHDDIVLIVAELTANAVRHGHVPGRDFHLRLDHAAQSRAVRTEVTDTRSDCFPLPPADVHPTPDGDAESGRGLLLVARLATRWDWHPRADGPGKTVWAEYALPGMRQPRRRYGE